MTEELRPKRSEASLAAARHWSSNKRRKEIDPRSDHSKEDVIVISSEDEEDTSDKSKNKGKELKRSQIRLINNPSYALHEYKNSSDVNKDTVQLSDLVGSKEMSETYQFNFSVDLEFFLIHLHPNMSKKKRKIMFVTGSSLLNSDQHDQDISFIKSKFNISELIADLPIRFGTHHTKMMINFYEDETCEVVIMTCNLQKIDFGGLTQMCWKSGRLQKSQDGTTTIRGARFKKDLKNYLFKYKKKPINELAKSLDEYNFLSIDIELVASAPGYYDMTGLTDESEIYGYGKLYQVLRRSNLLLDKSEKEKQYNILAQVSSISYPFATDKLKTASIFSHILCPLAFADKNSHTFEVLEPGGLLFKQHQSIYNYKPHIVYPCAKDIASSNVGFASGQAIHFKYTTTPTHRNQYEQNIKPYLYKWRSENQSEKTGRESVPPHVKLYMCDNGDNWSTLRWVLMSSHNLSKQAWGARKELKFTSKDPRKYVVASYELGVLVPGTLCADTNELALEPIYGKDSFENLNIRTTPLRMPFLLPPTKYEGGDKPWSAIVNFGNVLTDRFGQHYNGLDG